MDRLCDVRVIERGPEGALLAITADELIVLANALNEILHGPDAVEEWEFSTRLGVSREAADALHRDLSTAGQKSVR